MSKEKRDPSYNQCTLKRPEPDDVYLKPPELTRKITSAMDAAGVVITIGAVLTYFALATYDYVADPKVPIRDKITSDISEFVDHLI